MNENMENIGARRLHTVLERLLETVSFGASDHAGQTIMIDEKYVNEHLEDLVQDRILVNIYCKNSILNTEARTQK